MSDVPHLTALMIIGEEERRYSLDRPLRRAGFKIRDATNGEDGLCLAMEAPDLILLDLQLPDMTGLEVCRRLKAHAATASIPVLHLSDVPIQSNSLAQHLERGEEAYLTYPVEEAELLSFVNTLIRGRQVQRQFSSFLEAAPDAVVISDQDGKIIRVNGRTELMFGHGRVELIGEEVETLLPERFRSNHRIQRARYAAQPSIRPMGIGLDLLGLRKNGSEFPIEISLSPMVDHRGVLIACIVRDVTERKSIEQNSHDSEIRYRRLFETAKDGILILDTESGRITDANPFMSELLGYSHDHFLGKELWEIGLFTDKVANESAVHELQTKGYIRYEHLPLETNTGQTVEVEIVANSYREGDHSVIQCNIRDITERSRLETERNHLEIQMRQQSVALEDLHRRKDEFLAMLSHELRNPLSPIASALQLLSLQKNEDRLQLKARTIIERQVGQLTRLIDDLLEVSRITTGRIHLQQDRVSLNAIVEHAVETVRPLLVRHKHELILSLCSQPIWLFGDASRLEQVVVNLLTNAAKYTEDSGQIWLTVEQDDNDGLLSIRDTGVGIAPELLPHIFDLFTQSDRSLDRSQGGLGIGLALVQRIVELHKGRVDAISTLGKGSEFVVRLPAMVATATGMPPVSKEAKPIGPSLRILVVDDNEDAADTLGMLLVQLGHEVLTVHDGPSTLIAAADFHPDLVLLDIGLPGMDGFEVARQMRQQDVFKEVILVAMTGYGQDSDRQRSEEAGFDHHLVKPPDFIKLQNILATALMRV